MFKIKKIEINGFWYRHNASCDFNMDTNIIIGRNGTGKTTFMNILQSVLSVDVKGLSENDFDSATIILGFEEKTRTIRAEKQIDNGRSLPIMKYSISGTKFLVPLFIGDERRYSYTQKRHHAEASRAVREELDSLLTISSLSVYRLRHEDEFEVRNTRNERSLISPVDYRLEKAIEKLAEYQLRLSAKARDISSNLRRDVLASLLFKKDSSASEAKHIFQQFDPDNEESKLINAYTQLNAFDADVKKKIKVHVKSATDTLNELQEYFKSQNKHGGKDDLNSTAEIPKIEALTAHENIQGVIKLSLEAESETTETYSQLNLFRETLESFIEDKKFTFDGGKLSVSNEGGFIEYLRLSSGEKQLMILLIEALLQNNQPHIFLTDEPELSLHISWQRKIIPAVRNLNPSAQIIVATHSPEVAASASDDKSIYKMSEILHG